MITKNLIKGLSGNRGKIVQKFAKDTIVITVLWVTAQALNYFFNIFVANELSKPQFAQYGSLLGFIYVFSVIGETLNSYITKETAKSSDFSHKKFRKVFVNKILPYVIILEALILGLSPLIAKWLQVDIHVFIVLTLVLAGFVIWGIIRGSFMGKQMIVFAYALVMLEAIFKYAIGYWGITNFGNVIPAILAYGAPGIVVAGIGWFIINQKEKSSVKEAKIKINLKHTALIMINLILFNAIFTFDTTFLPFELRADYTAISILGKVVFFAASMTIPLMFTRISKSNDVKERKLYLLLSLSFALLVGSILTLIYKILGYDLITLLYNGKYYNIETLLPIYSIGATFYAFGLISLNYNIARNKYKSWILLAIALILQFLLLTKLGTSLYNAVVLQTGILFTTGLFMSFITYLSINKKSAII